MGLSVGWNCDFCGATATNLGYKMCNNCNVIVCERCARQAGVMAGASAGGKAYEKVLLGAAGAWIGACPRCVRTAGLEPIVIRIQSW